MIQIPSTDKKWTQNNQSDLLGNIWSSFNLDPVSNLGRLRVSPRLMPQPISGGNTFFTTAPAAFRLLASKVWTISGTRVHTNGTTFSSAFSTTSLGSDPTNLDVAYSDMEVFNNRIVVSSKSENVYYTDGTGAWTSFNVGGGDVGPHPMTTYANLLYYVRADTQVYKITTGWSPTLLLTLGTTDAANRILWMRSSSNRIWLGTLNNVGGKANIFEWDGASSTTTRAYRLQAQGALACVIKDDIPYVMDSDGRLLVWTGASFKELARLPIGNKFLHNATSTINNRFIHINGMSIINNRINLLIGNQNADFDKTINENIPSGVWEYDENIGLYHKYSFSYYAASSGTITDYGQNRVASVVSGSSGESPVGALSDMKLENTTENENGTFRAGVLYGTNATATTAASFVDDSNDAIQKSGYFVTTWIDSQNVKDNWQKIFTSYKQLLTSTDKIILKYRTTESASIEISLTWVDTDTFTTTTNVLGREGQEVEIIQGTGSGKTAHITTIDVTAGVYTVNLDDTFTGVTTGTAKARLQKWIKIGEITGQSDEVTELPIGTTSVRIQLKCCIISTGKNELNQLALINKENQLAK